MNHFFNTCCLIAVLAITVFSNTVGAETAPMVMSLTEVKKQFECSAYASLHEDDAINAIAQEHHDNGMTAGINVLNDLSRHLTAEEYIHFLGLGLDPLSLTVVTETDHSNEFKLGVVYSQSVQLPMLKLVAIKDKSKRETAAAQKYKAADCAIGD